MLKIDPAITTIGLAAVMAIAGGFAINALAARPGNDVAYAQSAAAAPQWAASATGRVEPKDGEIRIASQMPGRIVEVLAKTNDKVQAGDLLLRLDDQDIYTKVAAALAEVGVRVREREEEKATGLALDRRTAEDAVADAERTLFAARESFDAAVRSLRANSGNAEAVAAERTKVASAKAKLDVARASLATVNAKSGMPNFQRLESSLALARSELSSAEIALERTRVRAPTDGTVLNMIGKMGETAVPSPESALLVFGDLSGLRVRAEVEERDAAKITVGQKVVVKADAFPDKQFEGAVTSISQSLGTPRIATRGPRRPNDVEVVEVMVGLDGNPPLFTGMRVDTYFKLDGASTAAATAPSKTN
ncbi:MAG: HlyD family efflux transporter periplasmic adaptor subunit [Hyphomicrobium sp.]|nr:HlyD family efflux transporter periplasmic adaptor subunit [Hyphomicrobium sp.]